MASIKGGGRAGLTPELEAAIVDHLRRFRDPSHPLIPTSDPLDDLSNESDHDADHNRKKFLKKLIRCHEKDMLDSKVNQEKQSSSSSTKKSSRNSCNNKSAKTTASTHHAKRAGGKVRVDLVEALYKKPTKWKPGSKKKTVVFERATAVSDFLSQAKSKLGMKKACRCFVVENKVEVELTNDLQGIKDGTTIYLTKEGNKDEQQRVSNKMEPDVADSGDDAHESNELNSVKRLYATRTQRAGRSPITECVRTSEHVDKLPELTPSRARLPAANFRRQLLEAMDQSRVVVVSGSTGCGKSTQCPQFLLEGLIAAERESIANIVVTQPRRVAAMALAERVASERSSPPPGERGSTVGYQVRLDNATTETTRITYCTVGILLRRLTAPSQSDQPPLCDVSHLVIDEVHERDLNTDFCLTVLRRVLVLNQHLKLVLMSATNTPDLFLDYFRSSRLGIEPSLLTIPGRTHPVDIVWLDQIERMLHTKYCDSQQQLPGRDDDDSSQSLSPRASSSIDNNFIVQLLINIVKGELASKVKEKGACLVFLPGRAEIESLSRAVGQTASLECCDVHALHSAIPKNRQRAAFQAPDSGRVKIVLATNIAETSITIPDVTSVIDTGSVKESRFNSSTRIKELVTVWISRASATQRTGRAGRVSKGTCFRLYKEDFSSTHMLERTTPEILRTALEELVLQACLLEEDKIDRSRKADPKAVRPGTNPVSFLTQTPDPPPQDHLEDACEHLAEIGAFRLVSEDTRMVQMTPLGYHLAQLPMDAKIGKLLIVGSILGCTESALTMSAALSTTRNLFRRGRRDEQKTMVEQGFGGVSYQGGTVKGDTIASVAAFQEWKKRKGNDRWSFAKEYGLDFQVLDDMSNLRHQYRDCLIAAGFLSSRERAAQSDALMSSCCLVAALYPNVASLVRPVKGKLGFKGGGRLLTKDGDVCTPSSQSFQAERIRGASERGKDAYAVYHSKMRILASLQDQSAQTSKPRVFLNEVNFVSRYAVLLFGGDLAVKDNCIVVDSWLKFKVGEKGRTTAILFVELRRELDAVLVRRLSSKGTESDGSIELVRLLSRLLQSE